MDRSNEVIDRVDEDSSMLAERQKVRDLLDTVTANDVKQVEDELAILVTKKRRPDVLIDDDVGWSTAVVDGWERKDVMGQQVESNSEIFEPMAGPYHDAYYDGQEHDGMVYWNAAELTPNFLDELVEQGVLINSDDVQAFRNRHSTVGKYKIFRKDVIEVDNISAS